MIISRVALALSAAALVPFPLMAASGGSGGSLPSASTPQYDPAAEYRSGLAALESEDFKTAEKHFARVVSAAPRDANSHYLLGLAKAGSSNFKAARKAFGKAVTLDPDLVGARQQLALAHARLGEADLAAVQLDELRKRLTSCGTCPQASELSAAVAAVEAAIRQGPQAFLGTQGLLFASASAGDAHYLEAIAFINERRYEDAIASLRGAQASFGPHPDVLTYLGFAHRKLGRLDAAERFYQAALRAAPEHLGATEYYGELKVERGDLAGAARLLARLDTLCAFGCAEAEELRRWIDDARIRS